MKILIDTNIVLDIALERREFCNVAKELVRQVHEKNIHAYLTATTVTDIYMKLLRQSYMKI